MVCCCAGSEFEGFGLEELESEELEAEELESDELEAEAVAAAAPGSAPWLESPPWFCAAPSSWALWSVRGDVGDVVWADAPAPAACVGAAGGAAAGGAAVEPRLTGMPTVSTTVFACEKSHADADVLDLATAAGASEYESVTTGTRVRTCLPPTWRAGRTGATAGAACSLGTASSANETEGRRRVGSGDGVATGAAVRSAIASGPT